MLTILSIAWQVTYTLVAVTLLIGLAAVILVGAVTCVRQAVLLFNRLDLPEGD